MEKKFTRDVRSLESIFDYVREFVEANDIGSSNIFQIDFIIEELFTNMVKYNADNPNEILVRLDRKSDRLIMSLVDTDVDPFDVTNAPVTDTDLPLQERTPCGLGLQLVKQFSDGIDYAYKDRQSTITVVKTIE